MTCNELIDFLADYLDGALAPEVVAVFEHHLSICPDCVAYMDSYKKTVDLLQDAGLDGESEVPEDVPQSLIDAILNAQTK